MVLLWQYLWGVILVKQAMITIMQNIVEKKKNTTLQNCYYSKVRKKSTNLHKDYKMQGNFKTYF